MLCAGLAVCYAVLIPSGKATCQMQYQRLLVLLEACDPHVPQKLPKGVGLKTLIEAREYGLVELYGEIRCAKGVLTEKGVEVRETVSTRHIAAQAASLSSSSTPSGGAD